MKSGINHIKELTGIFDTTQKEYEKRAQHNIGNADTTCTPQEEDHMAREQGNSKLAEDTTHSPRMLEATPPPRVAKTLDNEPPALVYNSDSNSDSDKEDEDDPELIVAYPQAVVASSKPVMSTSTSSAPSSHPMSNYISQDDGDTSS